MMDHTRLRWPVLCLALAFLAMACRDGTGPGGGGTAVRIYLGTAVYDEVTIEVGASLLLQGRILDATGKTVQGEEVQWRSDNPEVATVDGGGLVRGVGVGTANIIASHRVGEATARINVALPVTGPLACAADEGTAFALGETRVLSGPEAVRICLAGGADYALVLVNAGTTAAATLQTRIRAADVRNPIGGPTPALLPFPATPRAVPDVGFHRRLRSDVSARLEARLRSGVDIDAMPPPRLQSSVGQLLSFNVETASSDGCSNPQMRGSRVRAISQRAIVVADTLNPMGGYETADYEAFGRFFDEEIWPLVTANFGEPTDIDSNGKVFLLFTRAVNERPENSQSNTTSYVGGFFFNRDLFPTSGTNACAGSNVAEIFYLLVPDPTGAVQGRTFSRDFVSKTTRSVLVHEFQHLVNDSRRLHVTKAPVWEETWLNEGLSHIAEELMFYARSGLSPRSNLDGPFQVNTAAGNAFEEFQRANIDRLANFLRNPETSSLMGPDGLATRGAAWHFLRYAADRRGEGEAVFWRKLVFEPRTAGLTNLAEALGQDPRDWIRDWAAAIYLDDTGFDADVRYRVGSWNFRKLYAAPGMGAGGVYPLKTFPASPDRTLGLQGAGTAYIRTGVNAGQRGSIRVTVADLPPPSRLKVFVTRTQ